MANYNVTLNVGFGKGGFASWTSPSGNSASNPVEPSVGDTVTFIRTGNGNATVSALSIFTDNSSFTIAHGGASVSRTVASGITIADSVTGTNAGTITDTLFLERQGTAPDSTPEDFDFTNQTSVVPNTTITSYSIVTIAGLDTGVSATVTVSGGTYSKDGAAYVNTAGTAINGTTFQLRHTSSSSYSTPITTTLTVGGVSGSLVSTTQAQPTADSTPDAFTIADRYGATSTVQYSYARILGINQAVTLSVGSTTATWAVTSTGAQPASSAFGTTANSITNGQYLHVKQTSPSSSNQTLNTVFTVGGVSDTWSNSTNPTPDGSAGDGGYGFQQFDDNNNLIIDSTSSVKTFVTYHRGLTINLYPPSLGNTATYPNTFDLTVPDLTSQQDFVDNYVITRRGSSGSFIWDDSNHASAFQSTNTIRFTWAGTCSGTCNAFDGNSNTFDIVIIGKTL
jgi:hypothetical protein